MDAALFWGLAVAGLAVAYLIGSTPTAYVAGRLLRGVDIREHGSRSVGATNALRVLGTWPGLAVLAIDLLKGVAAIAVARWLFAGVSVPQTLTPWAVALAGLAVVVGHSRSVWLGFAGGKSAATGLGVLLAISWPVGLGSGAVFVAVVALSRIVSLGSMLGAVSAIALVCVLPHPLPYRLLVIAGGLYVIARHRANIGRLLAGTEPRLGQTAR